MLKLHGANTLKSQSVEMDELLRYATLNGRETIGEKALWQSVVMQAIIDIKARPKDIKDRIERAKTIAWFSNSNSDFKFVCALADLDPARILRSARKIIQASKKPERQPRRKALQTLKKNNRKAAETTIAKKMTA